MALGKDKDDRWLGVAESLRVAARTLLHREARAVVNYELYPDRETNLNLVKQRWVQAQSGREVVAMRAAASAGPERWIVVFVEDGKGLLRAHGATFADALERALLLLALATDEVSPCDSWD